jgi:hypothetical protein
MDHSAVADWGEQCWEGNVLAKHVSSQIAARHVYRLARPECHIFKYSNILPQGNFVFGTAIDVIKDQLRKATTREVSKVGNIDDMRRGQIWQTIAPWRVLSEAVYAENAISRRARIGDF